MGFSLALQSSSGISCVGARFSSIGSSSSFFGSTSWQPQPARLSHLERRFTVAAVRSEASKEEEKKKSQLLGVASASIGFNTVLLMSVTKPVIPVLPRRGDTHTYSWLSLPLVAVWGAIVFNAIVQYKIVERLACQRQRERETLIKGSSRVDVNLTQRVADLEEDAREFISTARALSKQVEKLGVRFRATKRTLRDPMVETATIAQRSSEVTTLLTQREDRLEEELRGLQRALLAMQEHQVKQLALISLALKRTQNTEPQPKKLPQRSVNGSVSTSADKHSVSTSADTHARQPPKQKSSSNGKSSDLPKPEKSVPSSTSEAKMVSSPFSSEESLSKVDFWKDSVTSSAVIEKMTVEAPAAAEKSNSKSKMDSFFNGRKTAKANNVGNDEGLPEAEDAESYVEQPDYDSDSWLR